MKIAVVTGASSGMGREFVYYLEQHFARDLLNEKSFSVYQELLKQERPEISFLINAAGFGLFGTFVDMDLGTQLDSIRLNAGALTAFCHMSIPYMHKGSFIINLASNSSWQPVPYINVYGATKSYVMSFSRALGVEIKSLGIHVIAVAPGWIKTEFFDTAIHDDTITYFDRYYTAKQVVDKAMKDLKKRKAVSILGFPVRMQVMVIKFLPVSLVMKIWCRQQKK